MGLHPGNQFDDTYDNRDETLPKAIIDIGLHIYNIKVTTVGEIRRAFPHYTEIIWDTLRVLKLDGLANYDEHSPAPTKITSDSIRRALPNHWNNSALYAKTGNDSRIKPDSSSYEDPRIRITA